MKSCTGVRKDFIGPHCKKTCLRDLRPGKVQVSLLSCRDYPEYFVCKSYVCYAFPELENKGADKTVARMRTFVVLIHIDIFISLTTRQVPA